MEGGEVAGAVGTEAEVVSGFGAEGAEGEGLLACGDELDGAAEAAGGERDERGVGAELAAGAEGAADERAEDADLGGLDAEGGGDAVLEAADVLRRLVDGEFFSGFVPGTGGLEEFERVVVLGGGLVPGVDDLGGCVEAFGERAGGDFGFAESFGFNFLGAGTVEGGGGSGWFVMDGEGFGGGFGLLAGFGQDDGYDLAGRKRFCPPRGGPRSASCSRPRGGSCRALRPFLPTFCQVRMSRTPGMARAADSSMESTLPRRRGRWRGRRGRGEATCWSAP